jgi:hypothetical protein
MPRSTQKRQTDSSVNRWAGTKLSAVNIEELTASLEASRKQLDAYLRVLETAAVKRGERLVLRGLIRRQHAEIRDFEMILANWRNRR